MFKIDDHDDIDCARELECARDCIICHHLIMHVYMCI